MYTPTPSSYNSLRMVRRTTTVKTQATQTQSEIDASIARANALELEYELNVLNREQSRSSKYGISGGGGFGDSQSGIIDGLYWTTTGGTTTGTSFADGDSISRPRTQATGTIGDYEEDIYSGYSVNLPECIAPTLIDQSPSLDYLTLSPRATRKIISTFNFTPDDSGKISGKKFIKISSSNRHPLGQCRQLIALHHQQLQQPHIMSTGHHRQLTQLRPSTAAPGTGEDVEDEQITTSTTTTTTTTTATASHDGHSECSTILPPIDRSIYVDTVSPDESIEHRKQQLQHQPQPPLMKNELTTGTITSASLGHSSKMDRHLLDQTDYSQLPPPIDEQFIQGDLRSQVTKSIDQMEMLHRVDHSLDIGTREHESSNGHQLDHSTSHLPTGTISKKSRKLTRSAKSIRSIDSTSPPSSTCQSLPASHVQASVLPVLDSANLPIAAATSTSTDATIYPSRKEVDIRSAKHKSVQSRSTRYTTLGHYASSGQGGKEKSDRRIRAVSADDLGRNVDSSTSTDSDAPVPVVTNLPPTPTDRRHSLSTIPTSGNLLNDDEQLFTFSRPIKLPSPSSSTPTSMATLKRSTGKIGPSGHSSSSVDVIPSLPFPVREKLLLSGKVKLPSETVPVRKVTSTVSNERSKGLPAAPAPAPVKKESEIEDDEDDDEYDDETEKVTTTTTTTTTMTGELSGMSITSPDSDTAGKQFGATTAIATGDTVTSVTTTTTTTTVTNVNVSTVGQRGSIGSSSNYVTATEASLDRGSGTIENVTSVNTPFETVSSCTASYYSSPSSGVGKVEATSSPLASRKSSQESWSTGQQTPARGHLEDGGSSDSDVTGTALTQVSLLLLYFVFFFFSTIRSSYSAYPKCRMSSK